MAHDNPSGDKSAKLWGGRFQEPTDDLVARLNNSLSFDQRMWRHDIRASIAHVTMLGEQGIIPSSEAAQIAAELRAIERDIQSGAASFDQEAEDIHSALESLLTQRIGPVAGKLHSARSRNDQVATDFRLYTIDAIDHILGLVRSFQHCLVDIADGETETVLPGCTHLQHGQPVVLAHHLLAYFWMMERDHERLVQARHRTNALPLGAGALAGTTFPIDRQRVADLLGFASVIPNSLDAVSDRDFVLDTLSAASILMMHCSRLAEDIIVWNTPEFAFVALHDSVATGSSIMPQKKNPDVAELARGKAGRVFGDLMTMLTVMKGLPLSYNKDMQEDKEALFDAVDTVSAILPAFERLLRTAIFRRDRMLAATTGDFSTATDLADYLVRQGMPFRAAHEVVGRIVLHCVNAGIGLESLDSEALAGLAGEFAGCPADITSVAASVGGRTAFGGTAPATVREQITLARGVMSS